MLSGFRFSNYPMADLPIDAAAAIHEHQQNAEGASCAPSVESLDLPLLQRLDSGVDLADQLPQGRAIRILFNEDGLGLSKALEISFLARYVGSGRRDITRPPLHEPEKHDRFSFPKAVLTSSLAIDRVACSCRSSRNLDMTAGNHKRGSATSDVPTRAYQSAWSVRDAGSIRANARNCSLCAGSCHSACGPD